MAKILVFALVAGLLAAGVHAQESVKVGDLANVNVGPDGKTSVQAPFTNVNVEPKKNVKVGVNTAGSTGVKGAATGEAKKAANVTVDVKVGGAAQTSVSVKTPEKSTTTTAATKTTASKPQKPEKSTTAAAGATAAAKPEKPAAKPAAAGAVVVSVDVDKSKSAAAATTTKVEVDKSKTVQVAVAAPGTKVTTSGAVTTVTAPAKTTVAASGSGNTEVKTPGANVSVTKTPGAQPVTTVDTVAGVAVQNSAAGTTVSNIPYVGTVQALGRKMLRA